MGVGGGRNRDQGALSFQLRGTFVLGHRALGLLGPAAGAASSQLPATSPPVADRPPPPAPPLQVLAVAGAVGVVAVLVHLATPVIDNTIRSFPSAETVTAISEDEL